MEADNKPDEVSAAGLLLMTRATDERLSRRFLLMRHAKRWDLPKGHAQPGESPEETALRETEEETGITASQITLDPHFRYTLSYPVRYKKTGDRIFQKTVHFFLGYVEAEHEICCTEHLGHQWFSWDPPHQIQSQSIDPLLAAAWQYLEGGSAQTTGRQVRQSPDPQ